MRMLITLAFIIFLTACTNSRSNYTQSSANWVGRSANDLISAWGKPQQIVNSGGRTLYIYRKMGYALQTEQRYSPSIGVNVNATGNPVMAFGNPQAAWNRVPATESCTITVEVDKNNTVVGSQAIGNNCNQAKFLNR
jgi:hypothetical protein